MSESVKRTTGTTEVDSIITRHSAEQVRKGVAGVLQLGNWKFRENALQPDVLPSARRALPSNRGLNYVLRSITVENLDQATVISIRIDENVETPCSQQQSRFRSVMCGGSWFRRVLL